MLLNPKDVGEAIKQIRGRRTQAEVSKQAGVPASQWNIYEGGKRLPGKETLPRLLKGLGCSEEDLFDEVLKARARRLGRGQGRAVERELPKMTEAAGGGQETQMVLTELRSLRAHLTMLATYFIGLDRRIEQLLGEQLPS